MLYKVGVLVGQNLVRFGGAVAKVFSSAWDLLDRFYARILRPFVQWSWSNIVKLHDWLKTTLGPVLKFLDAVRRDIETIYTKWLRPILDTIDAVRATLKLLADFHVPFAQAIDEKLAALEARLVAPIRLALSKINELIDWTDRIINFNGLFQRLTLIASVFAYERDMWAAWSLSLHKREIENARSPKQWPATPTVDDKVHETVSYLVNGDGPSKARIDEAVEDTMLNLLRSPVLLS